MDGFKKIWVGVLAIVFLIGVVACTKNEVKTSKSDSKEVIWYYPGNRQEDQQLVYDSINEKFANFGIKVKFEIVDGGAYNEKMNLLISSGGNYDICFTSSWTNNFRNNVGRGAYLSLNELLNNDAKKLKSSLPEYLWNGVSSKDKIYGVPNYQVEFLQSSMYITKEMAEKYNVDPSKIKSYKDIEPVIAKIKNNEPDKYPYQINRNPLETIYEFISDGIVIKRDMTKDNVKVYYIGETPEMKDYYSTLKTWYDKGYIRKDILTVTNDGADRDNLKYGIWWGIYKPGVEADIQLRTGKEVVALKLGEPYVGSTAGEATINAISAKSKVAKEAIKVLELFNTDKELYNLISFGIEGKHYTKISDNKITLAAEKKYQPNDAWKYGNQFNAYYTQNQKEGIWEETIKLNNEAQKSPILGFVLNREKIKNELAQINSIYKEFLFLETGAGYSDSKYNEYIEKLQNAGLPKVLAEVENQINEFFKNKK